MKRLKKFEFIVKVEKLMMTQKSSHLLVKKKKKKYYKTITKVKSLKTFTLKRTAITKI